MEIKLRLAKEEADEAMEIKLRLAKEEADENMLEAINNAMRLANEQMDQKMRTMKDEMSRIADQQKETSNKLDSTAQELEKTQKELKDVKAKLKDEEKDCSTLRRLKNAAEGRQSEAEGALSKVKMDGDRRVNELENEYTIKKGQQDQVIKTLNGEKKKLIEEKSALQTALDNKGIDLKKKGLFKDAVFIRELTHKFYDELQRLFGDLIDPRKEKRASWKNYKNFYNDFKDALRSPSPALTKAVMKITNKKPDQLSLISDAMSQGYHECSEYIHTVKITRPIDTDLAKQSLGEVGHLFPQHRDLFEDGIVMLHQLQVLV